MALHIAHRIQNLPNYPFVEISAQVNRLQAAGHDVIRMDMGSPDLPPPLEVRQKLAELVMSDAGHGYTGYRGLPAFRQAVARYYERTFGVHLDPDTEVLPLIGSKEGLVNATLALVGPGDSVLVPSLSYPAYAMGALLAEAEVCELEVNATGGYLADLSQVPTEVAQSARLLWVNYPHNPTGALASVQDYTTAVEFCRANNLLLMSDNPYFAVVFEGQAPVSALQAPGAREVTVEFMSLSKSHNMAGWRLGAAVGQAEAIAALLQVKSNVDSGTLARFTRLASLRWTTRRKPGLMNVTRTIASAATFCSRPCQTWA
ncbi:MAG: aminotransferase class I/II-fold pyridoxal phosphate-dependent enzyme [Anaerolineae bacterium]|nr:aminotransferase class I/II-fold pyridoxal phosphate-dependent enzyme [Anaerolineae bacterium]